MSTDIKYVLTQKGLDMFCHKFHIPEDVHPQLPSPDQTIHEMPTGKISVYTRFFEFANFRLPLSTFLVNVLGHYRINLSQLSVIAAAKVSHFEILCRVHNIEPTVGLFRCFYVNSKNKGWMSFSKRPDSDADPFPKSTEFNADDYAVLVAHPAPFWKFLEPFLCLVGMSLADPTKVKVGERERTEGEARLLDSIVGHVVPLLPVALARAESELEASADRLFNKDGSMDQGDSAAGSDQDAETELVTGVKIIADENVVAEKLKRPCKKRPVLLASSMLNVEVGVAAVSTLPLVTSSVSVTPEHESGAPTDSITGLNLRTIGASERFVISSDSSHHSSTHASRAEGDSIIRFVVVPPMMTEAVVTSHVVNAPSVSVPETGANVTSPVHASMFHDSDSTKTMKADVASPSYSAKQDLSMGSRELNAETLHQVFVLQWNVLNDSLLDDSDVSQEFVDHLAPPALFSQICEMDYHHFFTEFNVGTARQACLNAEVRMRTEYCLSERKRLESGCEKQADLLKARDDEVENLKAQLLLKETEAAEAARLRAQNENYSLDGKVAELQSSVAAKDLELKDLNVAMYSFRSQNDGLLDQIEEFQDAQMNIINDKIGLLEMALHLEEKFYPHLLNTISGRSRAIGKGMQDGLSDGIDHGKAGRSMADIVAYNPAAEADYNSALQRLREVDFPLLAELSSHKDASTVDIMDLLRLEDSLADALRMNDLQPDIEQLTLPIHRPEDQVVLGETSLSFALSVPLVDPLSTKNLIGMASTSGSVSTVVVA
ncbi:hypothetical protein Tco_0104065, partial [Tanacetum coccineum]